MHQKGFTHLILIFIFIFITVIGAILVINRDFEKPQSPLSPSSTPETTIKDWGKTIDCSGGVYTDNTVDFSINCPENFQAYVFKEEPTYDNLTEKAICLTADTKPDFDAASRCTGGIIIWANGDGWGGGCDEELRAQIEIDGEEITYCLLDSGFGMVFLGGQYVEGSGVNRFLITGNFTNTFTKDEALEILKTFQTISK